MIRVGLVAGVLMLTAGRLSGAGSWEFRHTIRPGVGIGPIGIGWNPHQVRVVMRRSNVKSLLTTKDGRPRPWKDRQAGAWIESYLTDPMGSGRYGNVFKVFYVDHKVVQLAVSSASYVTNRGARTRMTSREFRARHPSIRPIGVMPGWGGRVRAYDSPLHGLSVTYVVFTGNREALSAQEIHVHPPKEPLRIESRRHEGDVQRTDLNDYKDQLPPAPGS